MYGNSNNNNHKHSSIPPPPNPYPHLYGQPLPMYHQAVNPYPSYSYTQPPNMYPSTDTSHKRPPLPNDNMGPPHKKPKTSPERMSAHQLFAHRLSQGGDNNNPLSLFKNPYKKNEKIQVREGELPMWLDGTVIDIGYDWIQVRYNGFSKNYDSTIFVDPNHIEGNKFKIRPLSDNNHNIKSEVKSDDDEDEKEEVDLDINMALNNKLLLKQLQQLIKAKREELNKKKYTNVINDISEFLNGFDITNIPENKYEIVGELYVIYASCLGQKSEYNQAIKYCKKAINISSKHYKGYTTLAALYEFQQNYNHALKQYEIALKLKMSDQKKRQIQQSYKKLLIIIKNSKKKSDIKKEKMSIESDTDNDSDNDSSEHKPIAKEQDNNSSDSCDESTDSEDEPIVDNETDSDSDNESDKENKTDKRRGKRGTTLDERVMDTSLMSAVQKSAYENRKRNPNGFLYRFNEEGEKQKNGGWDDSEHKAFMKRVLQFGANIEWGFFSRVIEGRVGYQCSNYWRKLMDDGSIQDENYVIEKGKNGKSKRRQLKKKEICDKGGHGTDDYFEQFRRYQFTVKKDPSKTFKNLPCKHRKAPNGGRRYKNDKKKKGKKNRKDKKKKKEENKKEESKKEKKNVK